MRWKGHRQSQNVEDRRGKGGIARGGAKLSGWMIIAAIVFAVVTGKNPLSLLGMMGNSPFSGSSTQQSAPPAQRSAAEQELAQFSSTILASTEDSWNAEFQRRGARYQAPGMVIYEGHAQTGGCGVNPEAVGPFYCPADKKLYLALGFFRQLQKMGAPGDFAQAYVIAHEVGHHIQNITGTERQMRQMQQRDPSNKNRYSVLLELQADCYAGVWAALSHNQKQWLEPGDVEEGLRAAASIGDDTLQKNAGRRVNVESFTHGTSAQRQEWLRRGMATGDYDKCNTFQ